MSSDEAMHSPLLERIGHTPLLEIDGVFVKLECANPGGSVKDRIARHMVMAAIRRGQLVRGMTIVETTSGNTGIALAIVANTDPWTFVGKRPLRPTPEADFDSGLALYARLRMSTAGVLFSMARLSGDTPRIGRRGARVEHDLPSLTVTADEPMPVQVDGEFIGARDTVRFTSVPGAIHVAI